MIKVKIKNKKLKEVEIPSYINKHNYDNFIQGEKLIGKQIENNLKKLLAKGIDIKGAKQIGSGGNGKAYQLKNGDIFKITADESEAKTSNYIKKLNTKHLVKIKDVFKFPPNANLPGTFYGVLQEKLFPLPKEQGMNIAYGVAKIRYLADGDYYVLFRPWHEVRSIVADTIVKWEHNESLKKKYNKRDIEEGIIAVRFLDSIGFGNIINELYDNDIEFGDFGAGNIMKRTDGTLVLIDLGGDSRVPEQDNIETI